MRGVGGRPRSADIEMRNDRILAVAEAMIIEHGYAATTMEGIARVARVSKKTLYARWADKTGILGAVVERLSQRLLGTRLPKADTLPVADGLMRRAMTILHVACHPTAVRLIIITFREGNNLPELHRLVMASVQHLYVQPLIDYFSSRVGQDLRGDLDPVWAADTFLKMLTVDTIIAAANGQIPPVDEEKLAEHARKVCDLFLSGARP